VEFAPKWAADLLCASERNHRCSPSYIEDFVIEGKAKMGFSWDAKTRSYDLAEPEETERIVLVRLSALGDIVHSWPLAVAIREARPDCHMTWVVENHFKSLVIGHPAIDEVVPIFSKRWRAHPFDHHVRAEIKAVKLRLSAGPPQLCIDVQGLVKSALVTRWTRAVKRVGLSRPWRRELLSRLFYNSTLPGSNSHVVATNLELVRSAGGEPPGVPTSPDGSWLRIKVLKRRPRGPWSDSYAVILPGAGGESKILPAATLCSVADGIVSRGLDVVIAWGPSERHRAAEIVAGCGGRVHLAPKTDLEELAALLGDASLVVGGDTGPIHLAASFAVPTLSVFLTTDWRRNGPLGDRVAVISATEQGNLRPSGSAHAKKIRDVSAEEIIGKVANLIR
jgi:heptosyltransferase-1